MSFSEPSTLVDRLRGIYNTPIRDGCGPIDGKMAVTRTFDNLPPIHAEAANRIEALEAALRDINTLIEGPVHTLRFLARKALSPSEVRPGPKE